MGAGQSSGTDVGGSTMGYQVLRVYPNSPGSRAGLKAYFDFIVAIGNTRFNRENGSLREILKASVDQKLKMVVYNTRTKKIRETEIVPSTNWGGNGLLGVSIKHSSFDRADERVWHVIEVEPGSPSQQAGFQAKDDYVIGSDSILQENDDLYNLIEAHEGKALKLFVYNTKTDNCREVICHPNSRWGGKGLLGCEFGHGLLHRIPYMGGDENADEDPRASLLRNEQKPGEVNLPVPDLNNSSQFTAPNPLLQQFQQGPGHQLLQQALSDHPPQQQQPAPLDKAMPAPPPVPQTFAQLASAQFQSQQYQSPPQPSSPQVNNPNSNYPQGAPSVNNATQQTLPQSQTPSNMWPQSYQPQQSPMYQQQMQALQQPSNTGQQQHQQQQQQQQQATSAEKALPPMPPASQTFAQFASPQYQSQPYQPPLQQPNPAPTSPPNASYPQDLGPPPAAPQQPPPPPQAQTSPDARPPTYLMQQQPYLFQQQLQTLQHPEVSQLQQQHQQQQHQQHQPQQQLQQRPPQLHQQQPAQQQQQAQVQQPQPDFSYPSPSIDSSNQ